MTPIFHLSLSVSDLDAARAFYCDVLGAKLGRITDRWIDLWLLGCQLTCHQRPDAVTPSPYREAQHFGATVGWDAWRALDAAVSNEHSACIAARTLDLEAGRAKLVLLDPDGYRIELKAYRDMADLSRPSNA